MTYLFKLINIFRWEGIQDQDGTNMNYIEKVRQFHRTPVVRMFYNFVG